MYDIPITLSKQVI